MAEGEWSQSTCDSRVWWYGVSGQGAYYWTAEHGTFYVSGGLHAAYASQNYECGLAKEPVKAAGWVAEMNYGQGCPGQWFANAAIGYHDGAWRIMYGYYGQHHLVSPGEEVLLVAPYVESPPPVFMPPPPSVWKRTKAAIQVRPKVRKS